MNLNKEIKITFSNYWIVFPVLVTAVTIFGVFDSRNQYLSRGYEEKVFIGEILSSLFMLVATWVSIFIAHRILVQKSLTGDKIFARFLASLGAVFVFVLISYICASPFMDNDGGTYNIESIRHMIGIAIFLPFILISGFLS